MSGGVDTVSQKTSDSLFNTLDTIPTSFGSGITTDSLDRFLDSLAQNVRQQNTFPETVAFAKDSLDAPVEYTSTDSMHYDIANEQIHLWGSAEVKYQELSITAPYIIFNWGENLVTAQRGVDSLGQSQAPAKFTDGEQQFTAGGMRYNFKTNKGIIFDVKTTQGNDLFVLSNRAKFVGQGSDSTQVDDVVYSRNSIFTTCNHDRPHFGIRSRKQKVIPNKVVVVGASNVEIMGVPTPLWLPFGFFPITKGRRAGMIFPRDYEFSEQWGFGLQNIGYYTPISPYLDLTVTGNVYTRGTWGVNVASQFKRRYKYNGRVAIGYSDRRSTGSDGFPQSQKSFSINGNLNQDSKAHPTRRISGSINIQTNNFQALNRNDAQSVLTNQLSSNVNFTKTFPDKPFNLTASFNHSQNTSTREVRISFPNVNFQMQRIYPFKRTRSNKEAWYEKISLQYTGELQNQITATDTTLFAPETLDNARFGARHRINSDAAFRAFKYFNITPSVRYTEAWYFKTLERSFDPTLTIAVDTVFNDDSTDFIVVVDTTAYGEILDDQVFGFQPLRQYNAGVSINTQIFGTRLFRKGFIRGIRHVIKPSLSFNFEPDYTRESLGYFREVDSDLRPEFNERIGYTIFQGGIFGQPSGSGQQMSLGYSINNIFEGKYWSRRDSTEKKFKFFDNLVINGNYNFAADSLNFSPVNMRGTTRLLKGLTTLNLNAGFDPYDVEYDENGNASRSTSFFWDRTNRPLRFVNASARINTQMRVSRIIDLFTKKSDGDRAGGRLETTNATIKSTPDAPEDPFDFRNPQGGGRENNAPQVETLEDFWSLFANFNISHQLVLNLDRLENRDTFYIQTNSLRFSGNIQLTDKWRIDIRNISYDFVRNSLVYPDIGFARDLHCWEMGMNWQPERGTYSFFIRVKPGTLDFLEIPYQKNNADAFGGF